MAKINASLIPGAKALVQSVVADPELIHRPELAFLKDFLHDFKVPRPAADAAHNHHEHAHDHTKCGHDHGHGHAHHDEHAHGSSAPRFEEATDEPEPEPEDEAMEDEGEDEGRVEPDDDAPAEMGDPSAEVTDEMLEQAQPAKAEAMELMSEGDLAGAIAKFTTVLKCAPTALAYANRAGCFAKLKKPNAAIRDCNAALALNADSAKAMKTRGKAYRMLGEWELAHADLTGGQKIDFDEETDAVQRLVAEKVKAIAERKQKRLAKDRELRQKKKAAHSHSAPSGAGMGGGMPGMAGMSPEMMQALMSDPELMMAMQSPKIQAAFADIQSNPANMMKWAGDPEVMNVVMKMQGLMGGGGSPF